MERPSAFIIGGLCLMISISQSMFLLVQHISYYKKPEFQLHICRIIIMVPIYSILSCLNLINSSIQLELSLVKSFYEAFAVYSFMNLLINYAGGDKRLSLRFELNESIRQPWPFQHMFSSFRSSTYFFTFIKCLIFQFVLIHPVLSVLSLVFQSTGIYHENDFSSDGAFFYIFLVRNLCFALVAYGFLLFFLATEELLQPFTPVTKFFCVFCVIFASYWQGIGLRYLENKGVIVENSDMTSTEVTIMTQNVIESVEMLIASCTYTLIFGYEEFIEKSNISHVPIKTEFSNHFKSLLTPKL